MIVAVSLQFRNCLDRALDGIRLVLDLVHRPLHETVTHEFESGVESSRRDARIGVADISIERQCHRHFAIGQRLELSPESGAHAVFMP